MLETAIEDAQPGNAPDRPTRDLAKDENLDEMDLPEWQRESLPKVRQALESEEFLPLPDKLEIHEWSIMERFANGQASGACEELLDAIHGAGALAVSGTRSGDWALRRSGFAFVKRLLRK